MSEELKKEETIEETLETTDEAAEAVEEVKGEDTETKTGEAATSETMADYEEHFDDANPWNLVKKYMEEGTDLHVTVDGVVNGGVITMVEGIRGFIPASKLSLSYVENLETYLLQEIDVRVIDADQANNRLVLSAFDILKESQKKETEAKIASIQVGTTMTGKVDSLQNYGAFVDLGNGLSGLVHISQISHNRIKFPSDVLEKGQEVNVKVIGIKDGKISLSMKALEDKPAGGYDNDYVHEKVDIPKSEDIGTSLGDLFKNIKLD